VLAAFVAYLSLRMIVRAINGLTDRILSQESNDKLRAIIEENPGVESLSRLRIRQAGAILFVEASVTINRVLPFAAIERIIADLEKDIIQAFPQADVTIHWRPIRAISEAPFETVKIVAGEFGLLPHNIEISETDSGKIALDYHLEFNTGTSLAEAESLSKKIETRLREELPEVASIFVHLEEERSDLHLPRVAEASTTEHQLVEEVKQYASAAHPAVRNVRDVHLFRNDRSNARKLVLTVDLARDLSLHDAHEIATEIEDKLRKRFPDLTRIVIRASAQ